MYSSSVEIFANIVHLGSNIVDAAYWSQPTNIYKLPSRVYKVEYGHTWIIGLAIGPKNLLEM